MKAITLWQPWAMLMALDEKGDETRSWQTEHRGPLAIHAAAQLPSEGIAFMNTPKCRAVLSAYGIHAARELPLGKILCVRNLLDVRRTEERLKERPDQEWCGNWLPGRFAWVTEMIKVISPPVSARGRQRIWTVPDELLGWGLS